MVEYWPLRSRYLFPPCSALVIHVFVVLLLQHFAALRVFAPSSPEYRHAFADVLILSSAFHEKQQFLP